MGLKCRIQYQGDKAIALNLNGTPSKLYAEALEVMGSEREALDLWAISNSEEFQAATGKVNYNDNVSLDEVIRFVDSTKMVNSTLTPVEQYQVKNLMSQNAITSLSDLASKLNSIFMAGGIPGFNPSAAIASGLYLPEDLEKIDVPKVVELVQKINGSLLKEDISLPETTILPLYKNPNLKTIIGSSVAVTQEDIEQELLDMLDNPSSEEEVRTKVKELPYNTFVENFYENDEFAADIIDRFKNVSRVPVLELHNGQLSNQATGTANKVRNTILENKSTLSLEADIDYLNSIPEDVWQDSLEDVEKIVKEIEDDLTKINVDIIGLHKITKNKQTLIDTLLLTRLMVADPTEANINAFSQNYDSLFGTKPTTELMRLPQEYTGKTVVRLYTNEDPQSLFENHGLIQIGENLYHKVKRENNIAELYEYLFQRVVDKSFVLPAQFVTTKDLNDKVGVIKDITKYVNSRETGLGFYSEEASLYQLVFGHTPLQNKSVETIKALSGLKFTEQYLKTDFVEEFYQYMLQEKAKNSLLYNTVLKHLTVNDKDITVTGPINSIEGIAMQEELEDYFRLKNDPSTNKFVSNLQQGAPLERLVATNFPQEIPTYNERHGRSGDAVVTAPTQENYIRIGNEVFKKVAENQNNSVFVKVLPNQSRTYLAYTERLSNVPTQTVQSLLDNQNFKAETKLSTEDIKNRKTKAGLLSRFVNLVKEKSANFQATIRSVVPTKSAAITPFELNLVEFIRQKGITVVTDPEQVKAALQDSMPMVDRWLGRESSTNITIQPYSITIRMNKDSEKLKTMQNVKHANEYYAKKIREGLKKDLGNLYRPEFVKSFVAGTYAGTSVQVPQEVWDAYDDKMIRQERFDEIVRQAQRQVINEYERVQDRGTMQDMGYSFNAMVLYTGSKASFDKFDTSKIGSGQGGALGGWGFYTTLDKNRAKGYAESLGKDTVKAGELDLSRDPYTKDIAEKLSNGTLTRMGAVKELLKKSSEANEDANDVAKESMKEDGDFITKHDEFTYYALRNEARNLRKYAKTLLQNEITVEKGERFLYELDVNDDTVFFDFDGKLKESQYQAILSQAVKEGSPFAPIIRKYKDASTGKSFYFSVSESATATIGLTENTDKALSQLMLRAGIVGNKMKAEGTTDYVIFDPELINIVDKVALHLKDVNFLETPAGNVLGFEKNGVIYLDETQLNNTTTLHELIHVYQSMLDNRAKQGDQTAQQIIAKRQELFQEAVDQWKEFHKGAQGVGSNNKMILGESAARNVAEINDSLEEAKRMESEGVDPYEIEATTGWFKEYDQWRYFSKDVLNSFKIVDGAETKLNEEQKLEDVIGKDNVLFKYYPKLRDEIVVFYEEEGPNAGEVLASRTDQRIMVNTRRGEDTVNSGQYLGGLAGSGRRISSKESLGLSLLHEIAHSGQALEGTLKGGSRGTVIEVARTLTGETRPQLGFLKDALDKYAPKNAEEEIVIDAAYAVIRGQANFDESPAWQAYNLLYGEVEARALEFALSEVIKGKDISEVTFTELREALLEAEGLTGADLIPVREGINPMILGGKGGVITPYTEVVNGFYSPLEKIIGEAKQDKMPAKQWIEKFARGEEAKWTGLTEWLEQQQVSISKTEIQQFLKENRIEIIEVVKGFNSTLTKQEATRIFEDGGYDVMTDRNGDTYIEKDEEIYNYNDMSKPEQVAYEVLTSNNLDSDNAPKFSQYQLEGEKENYKEIMIVLPREGRTKKIGDYTVPSPHQYGEDLVDNRRLVHLRMNTRTDVQGNKVLFLEEIQSDWGQQGKKTGFEKPENTQAIKELEKEKQKVLESSESYRLLNSKTEGNLDGDVFDAIQQVATKMIDNPYSTEESRKKRFLEDIDRTISYWGGYNRQTPKMTQNELSDFYDIYSKELENNKEKITGYSTTYRLASIENKIQDLDRKIFDLSGKAGITTAPFVTDTNAWVKLGLKVALKEAIAQGVDKIAWTTGEQQNERYSLEKVADEVRYRKNADGTYKVVAYKNGENISEDESLKEDKLEATLGKDVAQRIVNNVGEDIEGEKSLTGENLKVGGKGMKGFYGNPADRSIGIVGGVAEKLFGQKVGTVEISQDEGLPKNEFAANAVRDRLPNTASISTQHAIDVTPELKAQVSVGIPMFQTLSNEIGLDLSSPVYAQRQNETEQAYNERLLKEVEAYMVAPEIAERVEQMRKDNPSLWEEIMSFINNLKEWLKSQIGLSDYQGDIMSMTKQEYVDALGISVLKDDYGNIKNVAQEATNTTIVLDSQVEILSLPSETEGQSLFDKYDNCGV